MALEEQRPRCRDCAVLAEQVARLDEQIKAIVTARGELWAQLDQRFAGLDKRADERFKGSDLVRDEKATAQEKRLSDRINDVDLRYDQRFKDADLRYEQRFKAQTEAVATAFTSSQTATQAALQSAEKAVAAALSAADRAVAKAEAASEKRFESVNEFRSALADQATKLASRAEVEQSTSNLLDKIDGPTGISRRLEELARRVDAYVARGSGAEELKKDSKDTRQWLIGLIMVGALSLIGIALSIVTMVIHTGPTQPQVIYQQPPAPPNIFQVPSAGDGK